MGGICVYEFGSPGDDIGERVNAGFRALGEGAWITLPRSQDLDHPPVLETPIVMTAKAQRLSGAGHIATSLMIPANRGMMGLDTFNGREYIVEDLRIYEEVGSRNSCCFRVGGTTGLWRNVWAGNAFYGFHSNGGAGVRMSNCTVEACNYGVSIVNRRGDEKAGIPEGSNVREVQISQIMAYNCHWGVVLDGIGDYLLFGVSIDGEFKQNQEAGVVLRHTQGTRLSGQILDNKSGGCIIEHCQGFSVDAVFDSNWIFGLSVVKSEGYIGGTSYNRYPQDQRQTHPYLVDSESSIVNWQQTKETRARKTMPVEATQ